MVDLAANIVKIAPSCGVIRCSHGFTEVVKLEKGVPMTTKSGLSGFQIAIAAQPADHFDRCCLCQRKEVPTRSVHRFPGISPGLRALAICNECSGARVEQHGWLPRQDHCSRCGMTGDDDPGSSRNSRRLEVWHHSNNRTVLLCRGCIAAELCGTSRITLITVIVLSIVLFATIVFGGAWYVLR